MEPLGIPRVRSQKALVEEPSSEIPHVASRYDISQKHVEVGGLPGSS